MGLGLALTTGCATETDEGNDEPSTGESEEALCISPTGMAVPCPTGATCSSNFDCASGACKAGRCVAKDGERCSNDAGCASGFCHAGTCTACDNTQRFVPGRTDSVSRCTTASGWVTGIMCPAPATVVTGTPSARASCRATACGATRVRSPTSTVA